MWALLIAMSGFGGVAPVEAAQSVEGEFLVKFRDGAEPRIEAASGDARPVGRRTFRHLGWERVRLNAGETRAQLEQLRRDPAVLAVEPNYVVTALPEFPARFSAASATPRQPGDPLQPVQWALTNIAAPAAWQITTGSAGIVVAVIDTGINYHHEDLVGNLWRNPGEVPGNGIDDDGNGKVDDVFGMDVADDARGNDGDPFDEGANGYYHGSLVAGIIGARSRNGVGIAGLNHAVQLMAVRAIRASNAISLADELAALDYVLMMRRRGVNIRVVNMSYGGIPFSRAEKDAIDALIQHGIVVCAAAGNRGRNNDVTPFYPSSHALDGLIAVAATDEAGGLASFPYNGKSHYGRTSVDLAAPGLNIASTFGPGAGDYDTAFFGTSAATPHVSGAAALLLSVHPAATPVEVRRALMDSVDRLPALAGKVVSQGRLNIARALEHPLIAVGPPLLTRQPLSQSVVLSNRLVLEAAAFGQHPRALQWLRDETLIAGATNLSLTVERVGLNDAGEYRLTVSNTLGCATSQVATVSVQPLRVVNGLPDQSVRAGSAARFEAKVEGPKPVRFQWHLDGIPLPGETGATLKLGKLRLDHEGGYSFVASNLFGAVTSAPARLTVLVRPTIIFPPLSQSVVPGGSLTLSVGFTGNPGPFSVQWQKGSTTFASNVITGGESFLTLPDVQAEHAGSWRVTVRNPAGASGTRRSFTVKLLTDADQDGLPDAWEKALGYPTNLAQNGSADVDGDGLSDRDEYLAGTHPTNALSRLAILGASASSSGATLTFMATSNRTYTVERQNGSWGDGWQRVLDVPATRTNRLMTVTDPNAEPAGGSRFYRIVTPRRP